MKALKHIALFLFVIFAISTGNSQKIYGVVIDEATDEPIPFANIFTVGADPVGTTTDFDGVYELQLTDPVDSIKVSVIGYAEMVKALPKQSGAIELNFKLGRSQVAIEEITITDEFYVNPAHILLEKIIANKPQNNRLELDYFSCEVYNKVEIDLDNVSKEFQDRKLFKPFKFIFENIDSTSEDDPFLPIFLTETLSEIHHQGSPRTKREIIKATRMSGVENNNESVAQFLGSMYADVDLYSNWFDVLEKPFISPIANGGMGYYNYYLVDSAMIDGHWCYQVQFFPKRTGDAAFTGDMWVNDTTYALKQVNLQIGKDVNINFVKQINLYQSYEFDQGKWVLDKDKMIVKFVGPDDAPGIIGRKTSTFRDYSFQNEGTVELFKSKEDVIVDESVFIRDEGFWSEARHEKLSENEEAVYAMIDTIKKLPVIQTWTDIIQTASTGYVIAGPVEIGNIYSFVNFNDVEGYRFKLGMQTSNAFSRRLMIGAYGAYGLRDRDWKYGGHMLLLLSKRPRQSIEVKYRDDITSTSSLDENFGQGGILENVLLQRRDNGVQIPLKLLKVEELRFNYHKEWKLGLSATIGFTNRELDPYFNFAYLPNAAQTKDSVIQTANTTELTFQVRMAYLEKFLSGEFNRVSLGSDYTIVRLKYTLGIRDVMNSEYSYHRLDVLVEDEFDTSPFGEMRIKAAGGKLFGEVPYLLMKIPKGNEGYFYKSSGFNLINEYSFAADTYAEIFWEQHFMGYFFDKVPALRKLKLRSVLTASMFYGTMSKDNLEANELNFHKNTSSEDFVGLKLANKQPYFEAGVGIENIFRIFRIDGVWKLTHRNPNGNAFSFRHNNFGIRAGMELAF